MRGETIKTESQKYKAYLGLYKNYNNNLIKTKLAIDDTLLLKFLTKAIRESIVEGDKQIIFKEATAFSEDENDYGSILWPMQLTNIPIEKPELPKLTLAIKTYKLLFKTK